MLKLIKTYLLSYLSANQPAGTWLIAPPKIPKKRKNATWVMFRPEYDAYKAPIVLKIEVLKPDIITP